MNYNNRYTESHLQENINDVKHILKYFSKNIKQEIVYCNNRHDDILEAYCDAVTRRQDVIPQEMSSSTQAEP